MALSRSLKQLDKELIALGDEAMLIEELDGFFAGLLVCPELIMPSDWLPVVWNREGGDRDSPFDNLDHANRVLALVMEHYNSVARALMERPDRYSPLFVVDKRNGDVLWELWIEGFEKAVKLNPVAWQRLLGADADTAAAMSGLLALADVADRVPDDKFEALSRAAPDNIARWVVALNEWRLANCHLLPGAPIPRQSPAPTGKVGRNDPCPCGSGKKYKRCCGLNWMN